MGGKKGGGGHTPYEAPDNLKSAQRLSAIGLISLGPIRGAVTADQYQSAFFDYTPIKNSKGEWNYQNTLIRYRLGYQDQQPLEDFDASEREVSVGAEVKLEHPISRTVIDPDIDLLRITLGVNALFSQNDLETSRLEQCTISFSVGREGLQVRAKPSIFLMNQRQDYTSPTLNNY
ncbi:hypothetical protein Q7472_10735 [Glaesserella parasuis]|uniref:TipJ family phage tail tip protein n=5 Tax=Glaesserella parasuis TaxID=738 RepID=UPI0021BDDB0C|nr:hypothetical protein [Glaesserella parasuis]MCT8567970.1 hypothetical protein [Glaesserella parasuis]MCT8595138.1 hypothetical protein [Glaesserella parasuis]MCT8674126.1 hypothetical protein [Glaesserella parasuis]MCT8687946.1 hypothetical protein [Glaesserella parasuis]